MALELNFAERRVLGVLIEKGFTTTDQYPLTLNSVLTGCNQKSCRDPVLNLDEEAVYNALDSLRAKGLVTLVRSVGSRTDRFKHRARDTLEVSSKELAILAELILRGPQTDGELRQRSSRMVPIESLVEVGDVIERLSSPPLGLVVRLGPPGRRRGVKYAHTLYPPDERVPSEPEYDEGTVRTYAMAASTPETVAERPPSSAPGANVHRPPTPAAETDAGERSFAADDLERATPAQDSEALTELRGRVDRLEDRVRELEETFARFFR